MYECLGLDHACLQMELGIEDDSFWFIIYSYLCKPFIYMLFQHFELSSWQLRINQLLVESCWLQLEGIAFCPYLFLCAHTLSVSPFTSHYQQLCSSALPLVAENAVVFVAAEPVLPIQFSLADCHQLAYHTTECISTRA